MTPRVRGRHRIVVDAPVERCFMFFTPAGEELWVDGWAPTYLHPGDGRTEAGMVFTTGEGEAFTIWTLADFDRQAHRARYLRCTPASRLAVVEVDCAALDAQRTEVVVAYTVTALTEPGRAALADYAGERFAAMIDDWAARIAARLEVLRLATIL